jgi:hypothetical protein
MQRCAWSQLWLIEPGVNRTGLEAEVIVKEKCKELI